MHHYDRRLRDRQRDLRCHRRTRAPASVHTRTCHGCAGGPKLNSAFALIAAVLVASRLCHSSVLWADDNLPLAAAIAVARGKALYSDVWFDKPPLVAWVC